MEYNFDAETLNGISDEFIVQHPIVGWAELVYSQDKCRHNTIKLCKRHWFRRVIFWRCIKCDRDFDELEQEWFEKATQDRLYALELEAEVEVNEHGAWYGCKSVYVINEEP